MKNQKANSVKSLGWIKLHRSIREHWIWQDANKLKWWLDILCECNHADQKVNIGYQLLECKRGQSLNSLLTWSKRWRADINTVRRFMKLLESDKMIVIENAIKTTRLTVCNYDGYNDKEHAKDMQTNSDRQAIESQENTNKNVLTMKEDSSAAALPDQPGRQVHYKKMTTTDFKDSLKPFCDAFGRETINDFYRYWGEDDGNGKMRFQIQKTWNTKLRLVTWKKREVERKTLPGYQKPVDAGGSLATVQQITDAMNAKLIDELSKNKNGINETVQRGKAAATA